MLNVNPNALSRAGYYILLFNGAGRVDAVVVLAAAVGLGAAVAFVAVPLTVGLAAVRVVDVVVVVGFGLMSPLVVAATYQDIRETRF